MLLSGELQFIKLTLLLVVLIVTKKWNWNNSNVVSSWRQVHVRQFYNDTFPLDVGMLCSLQNACWLSRRSNVWRGGATERWVELGLCDLFKCLSVVLYWLFFSDSQLPTHIKHASLKLCMCIPGCLLGRFIPWPFGTRTWQCPFPAGAAILIAIGEPCSY